MQRWPRVLRACGWGLGLALFALEPRVRAQTVAPPREETRQAPPRVTLLVVGPAPRLEVLEARLESWFRSQPTELSVRGADTIDANDVLSPADEDGIRIWLVQRGPDAARLFFTVIERRGAVPRYLVRNVTLDGGFDELGVEQTAQVIYLSSSALWSGVVESTRAEVEERLLPEPAAEREPVVTASAVPARPVRSRSVLGFEYALRFAGDEGIVHGPAATFGFERPVGELAFGGRAQAALVLPHRAEKRGISLELRGASFTLGALLSVRVLERSFALAELGFGLDVVRYRVEALADPTLVATQSETEARPFLRLRAGLARALGRVKLGVAAGACLQLLDTHYDVRDEGGSQQPLLAPWQMQPELAGSITW